MKGLTAALTYVATMVLRVLFLGFCALAGAFTAGLVIILPLAVLRSFGAIAYDIVHGDHIYVLYAGAIWGVLHNLHRIVGWEEKAAP